MRNFALAGLLVVFVFILAGCKTVPKNESTGLDLERQPEVLIFDKEKIDARPLGTSAGPPVSVVLQPNLKGLPKTEEVLALSDNSPDDSSLVLKVLSKYQSGTNYILIYSVTNTDSKGRNTLFYRYGYDELNRIISSTVVNRYLASQEQFIERIVYSATGGETRWVLKCTYRR